MDTQSFLGPVPMSPVVPPKDPDREDLTKGVVRLPRSWWDRIDAICRAEDAEPSQVVLWLVRYSLGEPSPAPYAEGPELKKTHQSSVTLPEHRWDEIDAEAKARGLSRNKVFQAHLSRGFAKYDEEHPQRNSPDSKLRK